MADRVLDPEVPEVSTAAGATADSLAEAMMNGEVPTPELMEFQQWVTWRSGDGMRPFAARGDSVATTWSQESKLWVATMKRLFGDDWKDQLQAARVAAKSVP